MTSAFQTLAMAKSPIAAWPLEAGSGSDISGNGLNLTAVGTPGSAGPPLVAGGGASSTFDGSTSGFEIPHVSGWTALGLEPTTTPFSCFAWVAPAALQTTVLFGKTAWWQWGMKNNGQISVVRSGGTDVFSELYAAVPQSGGAFQAPYPILLGMSFDPVAGEMVYTINGRYSLSLSLASMGDSSSDHIFVGAGQDGQNYFFNGSIGHFYVYNRFITPGEMAELFRTGYIATPPAFTDIYDLQQHAIPAAGAQILNSSGVFQGAVSDPGNPLVTVEGSSAQKGPVSGYCSRCGGRMESNEAQVQHAIGAGAGLGGVGQLQPTHHACRRLRPLATPAYTTGSPPATYKQFCDANARLAFDTIQQYCIRNVAGKSKYLSINGQTLSSSFAGVFATNQLATRDAFQVAYACAIMHSYYKLPKNSWTRRLAELIIDQFISVLQVPAGSGYTAASANNGALDGSGAMLWYNATAKGSQSSAYSAQDDFYISQFGATLLLLAPWMSPAKVASWKASFLAMVNNYIGPTSNAVTYINPNRNMGPLLSFWIAYQLTGNLGYLQAYEAGWAFIFAPPALPTASTPIIQNEYPAWYALNVANWGAAGGSLLAFNSYPSTTGFGWQQTTATVLSDGSDGAGYFPEFNTGNPAPNGTSVPGYDGDYSTTHLAHLTELWCWTRDPRFLRYANMVMNYQLPFLDQTGGNIAYRVTPVGSNLGPATVLAGGSTLAPGATVIPCNLTSGMAFTVGQHIVIGSGTANVETLTIAGGGVSLGTPGSLTTTTATVNSHAVGENIGETTSNSPTFFTGWNLDCQLGARHNAIDQYFHQWPLISWGNGLRQASPFTLAQLQAQWGKVDGFYRNWVLNAGPGSNYAQGIATWMTIAMLADPNYQPPTSLP